MIYHYRYSFLKQRGDFEKFIELSEKVESVAEDVLKAKVAKALRDGRYDTGENLDLLASQGIEAGIKVREDADPRYERPRGKVVQAK